MNLSNEHLFFSIRYAHEYNLTDGNFYTENTTVLLPGGEGYTHETGKKDDYCLQWQNGTKIKDTQGNEYCESGNGIEITVTPQYKWQWQWVEIFEKLEGPFEGILKYVLREEAPLDKPQLDFVKPKYYLPAAAHPVFELVMYKGDTVYTVKK